MKEPYVRPTVKDVSLDETKGAFPLAGLAMAGGYVIGRAVTHAIRANPTIKLPNLTRNK